MTGKKKIKWRHILLALLLVMVCVVGIIAAVNYRNIMALYKGLTTDTGTLQQAIADNQKETADALSGVGMNVSEDDFNKMNSGALSKEEISEILYNSFNSGENLVSPSDENATDATDAPQMNVENPVAKEDVKDDKSDKETVNAEKTEKQENIPDVKQETVAPQKNDNKENTPGVKVENETPDKSGTVKPSDTAKVENDTTVTDTPAQTDGPLPEAEYNKKVADLVAQMYVIKSNFIGTLDAFENRIMTAWDAQPQEMKTHSNKAKIIAENTAYLVGLEAQCDAQVKAVTDELRELMKKQGKDTGLVESILTAYDKEKENRKAYYISEYS